MICNAKNWSNDGIESQTEKKACFNAHFQYIQSQITGLNKMWSLKSLVMLKFESRTSLHALHYKWQPGSILMFFSYYLKNYKPRYFVLIFCGIENLDLFLAGS